MLRAATAHPDRANRAAGYAGGRFGLFGSIGFLFSALMPVDFRA
jgi:hypothetical protein